MSYKRWNVEKAIVLALRELGGTASRKIIRQTIATNEYVNLKYEDVYDTKVSARTGRAYNPFLYDFNFGLKNLLTVGYISSMEWGKKISLTSIGRTAELSNYPTSEQTQLVTNYWNQKTRERVHRKLTAMQESDDKLADRDEDLVVIDDPESRQDADESQWKSDLIECLKKFNSGKFENFSRALISKMGVTIDKNRGVVRSADHGIDGFGYFKSDEFRTSRVAIQCKRYTQDQVSEPEIDKFKGVMDSFNAEYGIFVTTSHFTNRAKAKAMQGNNTVTLIDGQELADLVEKYELQITPIKTYTLNAYYYEQD